MRITSSLFRVLELARDKFRKTEKYRAFSGKSKLLELAALIKRYKSAPARRRPGGAARPQQQRTGNSGTQPRSPGGGQRRRNVGRKWSPWSETRLRAVGPRETPDPGRRETWVVVCPLPGTRWMTGDRECPSWSPGGAPAITDH